MRREVCEVTVMEDIDDILERWGCDDYTVTAINWDWKGRPSLEDLTAFLDAFGISVCDDPAFAGSDTYGYLASSVELSPDKLEEIGRRYEED